MNNIIFVGGIHGVGKGTICNRICEVTDFVHLSASEILKWNEISQPGNKNVANIQSTQDSLLEGLKKTLQKNKSYLLDGHFCLFNSEGKVEKVPLEIFERISPKLIAVVTTDVQLIKERLERRDNKSYGFEILKLMQNMEKKYAKEIAFSLDTPFFEIKDGDYNSLIKKITNLN